MVNAKLPVNVAMRSAIVAFHPIIVKVVRLLILMRHVVVGGLGVGNASYPENVAHCTAFAAYRQSIVHHAVVEQSGMVDALIRKNVARHMDGVALHVNIADAVVD
jgi:hypothetical protein